MKRHLNSEDLSLKGVHVLYPTVMHDIKVGTYEYAMLQTYFKTTRHTRIRFLKNTAKERVCELKTYLSNPGFPNQTRIILPPPH